VIGAAVLLFLWNLLSGRAPSVPTPAATAPATAPAPAPAPAAAAGLPAKVYFEVGAATIGAEGSKTIAAVAEAVKQGGLKLALTGYTDKTGDVAKNEELAKSRATAVRDALQAAGVDAAGIEMKAPMFVEVGGAGGDAEARRVEITKQ
jgi:outer membrane protein OmpA-like peptidoglycan-associated protein